ncbi:MAG: hypothetical protein ACR2PL_12905, partial [Dehalococcoidia bacterium]
PQSGYRKVTGGFRSERAAHSYAAIRTGADTARKRGQNLFALFLDAANAMPPWLLATRSPQRPE